jgi:hypothetical protein
MVKTAQAIEVPFDSARISDRAGSHLELGAVNCVREETQFILVFP